MIDDIVLGGVGFCIRDILSNYLVNGGLLSNLLSDFQVVDFLICCIESIKSSDDIFCFY